jgi:NAD(P)-dependent dehydrogenase (short-subunit alcohol dehydrogenase family)
MDLELKGRRALVTGSTSGIGFAIAKGLAAEGAHVTITGRKQTNVDEALATIRKNVGAASVDGVAADCATGAGAATVFAHTQRVDILVNNLGIYERKPAFEITDEEWHRLFEVNVMSGVRFARHYAPLMAKAGWGRVLFISSESALNIPREMIHYGMTKTAQLSIARGLAMELEGTGVTVNSLLPGPTRTASTERMRAERAKAAGKTVAELEDEFFMVFRPSSLLKRFTSADEVANMAVFLCSPLSSATNGAAVRVEGGIVNQIM